MSPSTVRVLKALRRGGEAGCTTAELCQPNIGGVRFGARIYELRAKGCVITRVQLRPGSWRYWLRDDPTTQIGSTGVGGVL